MKLLGMIIMGLSKLFHLGMIPLGMINPLDDPIFGDVQIQTFPPENFGADPWGVPAIRGDVADVHRWQVIQKRHVNSRHIPDVTGLQHSHD